MLSQRGYSIVHGYGELNDHGMLREDVLLQSVRDRQDPLGLAPTRFRLENRASRAAAWSLHRESIEKKADDMPRFGFRIV